MSGPPRLATMARALPLLALLSTGCGGRVTEPDGSQDGAADSVAADADAGPDCGCRNVVPLTFPLCSPEVERTSCPGPE